MVMKYEDEVLEYIKENPGCSDREIADFVIGIDASQVAVNIICRKYEEKRMVVRTPRPIRNYLMSDYIKKFGKVPEKKEEQLVERKPSEGRGNKKYQIIEFIKEHPGLSDRQITDALFGEDKPQQPVNIICRMLVEEGIIIRTERPIRNYIAGTMIEDVVTTNVPPAKRSNKVVQKESEVHTSKEAMLERLTKALKPMVVAPVEFKEDVSLNELLFLKQAVTPINNLITYELSLAFLKKLYEQGFLTQEQFMNQVMDQKDTSSNANGFDIFDGDSKMVGEVKGNDPHWGNRYGPAQVKSIIKDLEGLAKGKSKGAKINHDEYYKFMVLLDVEGAKEVAIALLRSNEVTSLPYPSVLVEDGDYKKNQINVVLVSLEN